MGNSFTMFVDPAFNFDGRQDIGNAAFDYIRTRSKNGLGVGGKPFGKYSKAYKKQRDFINAGKTGETRVNLTLTGDMLDSMEVLDASIAGRIVIGYPDGDESDKSVFMEEKGYAFLGLDSDEISSILSDFSEPSASLGQIVRSLLDVG